MPIQIKAPDGSIAQFPDGTPDATITSVMAKTYGGPQSARVPGAAAVKPKPAAPQTPLTYAEGITANFNKAFPLGRETTAGLGTLVDAATGRGGFKGGDYSLKSLRSSYDHMLAGNEGFRSQFQAEHPIAAATGQGLGTTASILMPTGRGAKALSAAPRAATSASKAVNALQSTVRAATPAARGAVTASATGALYAAADQQGGLGDRLRAASRAAVDPLTLVLGAGFGTLASRLGRVRVPKDKYSPEVVKLVKSRVQLTPGQARGGVAKALEDSATSLPIAGAAITEARKAGMRSYNRAGANDALSHLGEELPDHVPTGSEAVKYAGDRFSAAYKRLLPKGGVRADPEFGRTVGALSPIVETLTKPNQVRLENILRLRVMDRFGQDSGVLSGDMYQRVDRELEYDINRFKKSGDPDHVAMADALSTVQRGLRDAAVRQNPTFARAKAAIDAGYAKHAQIEDAAVKAVNEGGIYSPAQATSVMVRADKRRRVRGRGVARGEGLNQDFHAAAQQVLPSKVGNSGTADRSMVGLLAGLPGTIAGGGVAGVPGALAGAATTLAALQGVASRYSPRALELFNKSLSERVSRQEAQAALAELGGLAQKSPALQRLYDVAAARLARATGAVGGARAEQTNDQTSRLTSSTR